MRSWCLQKPIAALAVASFLAARVFAGADAGTPVGRPYLGIGAAAQEAGEPGVTVSAVSPESPAGKAGLKQGDRIVRAGDKEVKKFQDLRAAVARHQPGDPLALTVLREGKEQTLTVTLGDAPPQRTGATPPAARARAYLGVYTQSLTPALKDHLGLSAAKGVLVTQVVPDSPAAQAGLVEEDVVTHVGEVAVATSKELMDALQEVGPGKEVELTVARGPESVQLEARLQEALAAGGVVPEWGPGWPEGFEAFSGHLRPFFPEMERNRALQKQVEELEKRVRELEQKVIK